MGNVQCKARETRDERCDVGVVIVVSGGARSKTEMKEVERSKRDAVDTGRGVRADNDERCDDRVDLLA